MVAALTLMGQSQAQTPTPAPSPGEIVAAAPKEHWTAIAPSDLMVMDLAPLNGKARRVVIQLMPAPFSQGWVGNIRKLAAAKWWDGTSINRVQDNYVVQWGDATEKKALPKGLVTLGEQQYAVGHDVKTRSVAEIWRHAENLRRPTTETPPSFLHTSAYDGFFDGWPIRTQDSSSWPVHCYGMIGVGRNLSPDTGSGAELYTVIGHAPRHLDRNIALVGRVIEGIEHLSSLPRGTGALGFYENEAERVPILSVRIGAEASDLAAYEYLSTESESFARYADARANRRDPFFIRPAGGADICNIPVPVRRAVP